MNFNLKINAILGRLVIEYVLRTKCFRTLCNNHMIAQQQQFVVCIRALGFKVQEHTSPRPGAHEVKHMRILPRPFLIPMSQTRATNTKCGKQRLGRTVNTVVNDLMSDSHI